jgi:hypothetical protein
MPRIKTNLTHLFDGFIDALAGVVKEKVQLAVQTATAEFFDAKVGVKKAVAEKVEKFKTRKRRRRRGRPKGSKNKVAPVVTPKPKKAKRVKKTKVAKAEAKPVATAEPEKTE